MPCAPTCGFFGIFWFDFLSIGTCGCVLAFPLLNLVSICVHMPLELEILFGSVFFVCTYARMHVCKYACVGRERVIDFMSTSFSTCNTQFLIVAPWNLHFVCTIIHIHMFSECVWNLHVLMQLDSNEDLIK